MSLNRVSCTHKHRLTTIFSFELIISVEHNEVKAMSLYAEINVGICQDIIIIQNRTDQNQIILFQ